MALPTNEGSPQRVGPQAEAIAHMAIRHATAVAAASVEKKLTTTSSTRETVQLTRTLTELQKFSLEAELGFLDCLLRMDAEEILLTLFSLFDSDGSESVDKNELARNLKKLDYCSLSESVDTALLSIQAFDCDGDGCMDIGEFTDFLEDLVNGLDCDLRDLAQFLTLRVAFCENGSAVLNDAIVSLVQDSTSAYMSVEDFDDAVIEVRMMLLFQMIAQSSQTIPFKTVAKSVYLATQNMDKSSREALLMYNGDDHEERFLDYDQFSSLLLNIVTAGGLNFHDMANSITLSICKNDSHQMDLSGLFHNDDTHRSTLATDSSNPSLDHDDIFDTLQYARMSRLFDLWDTDHSGDLDFEEIVLGFRKFHEAKSIDQTVEECVQTIHLFDKDKNGTLSREEFAKFLTAFADVAGVSAHELIDFMVVTSALKDNDLAEKAYIESVKDRNGDNALKRMRSENGSSPLSLGVIWRNLRQNSSNDSD